MRIAGVAIMLTLCVFAPLLHGGEHASAASVVVLEDAELSMLKGGCPDGCVESPECTKPRKACENKNPGDSCQFCWGENPRPPHTLCNYSIRLMPCQFLQVLYGGCGNRDHGTCIAGVCQSEGTMVTPCHRLQASGVPCP